MGLSLSPGPTDDVVLIEVVESALPVLASDPNFTVIACILWLKISAARWSCPSTFSNLLAFLELVVEVVLEELILEFPNRAAFSLLCSGGKSPPSLLVCIFSAVAILALWCCTGFRGNCFEECPGGTPAISAAFLLLCSGEWSPPSVFL